MAGEKTFSRDTYEVTAGKVHHTDSDARRRTYVKGDRFQPTEEQLARGGLRGKVRKVERGDPKASHTVTADIGLRSLSWASDVALERAMGAGLTTEDFTGREPSGATGYKSADVTAVVKAKP